MINVHKARAKYLSSFVFSNVEFNISFSISKMVSVSMKLKNKFFFFKSNAWIGSVGELANATNTSSGIRAG
jgi:hypothetical protein